MKILLLFQLSLINVLAQKENKNWYFGTGTDGIIFDANNNPVKVNNKYPNVGYEGMVVVSDPFTGELLFYTDGITVINKNHAIMQNGSGLLADPSCSQGVHACKMPGECRKYYIVSNSSVDNASGSMYYSIVDFTSNPLGAVTIKNQLIGGPSYHQAFRIIPKANSNNFWMICHLYNTATYHVYEITPTGFNTAVVYNFNNSGRSYMMVFNKPTHKLVVTGQDNLKATMFDFNDATGVMSNEVQLATSSMTAAWGGNFSPDGTKLYLGVTPGYLLWQYDFINNSWADMNTCCWAHDVKTGPDGITYFIHTYNSTNPLAKITNANLTAVGNACGYATITAPGNFNGESRRFPEFLTIPDPPLANEDTITISAGLTTTIYPLTNDSDPQNDPISIDSILQKPVHGTFVLNNNQITYQPDSNFCSGTDTIIYRINDNICDYDTARIIIYVEGYDLSVSANTPACDGNSLLLNSNTITGAVYSWHGPAAFNSTAQNPTVPAMSINQAGYYVLSVIANGCTVNDSVLVNVAAAPKADFIFKQNKCSAEFLFSNTSLNASTYLWYFGDGDTSTLYSPGHTFHLSGVYQVLLIANPGSDCADTSTTNLEVYDSSLNAIQIPNCFTPNSDGKNEVFEISGINECLPLHLMIYNRWGQLIYETDDIHKFWDGKHRGYNVSQGVYYYVLEGEGIARRGSVTVIR